MAWRNWFVSSLLLLCWACGRQVHSGNGEMVGGYDGEVAANGKGVAAYYSRHVEDSLKWKAACFLLQNMEGHGSGGTGKDCEVLDSSWLVNHIERVFLLRDSCPWLEGMCFQTFLNYLLPYRVADEDIAEMEVLDTNRERRYAYALAYYDDCRKSASQLELFLSGEGLTRNRKQYADAVKEVAWLRAHGVPSAVDFIPVLTGSENAWVWVADDRLQPQLPAYVQRERVGKVYRSVFARQPIPDAGEEYVPAFFRNPFYQDVTAIYLEGKTVELALPDSLTAKYVYLAMPAGKDWQVVAWSETEGHSCRFEHVGSGNVYLPVYYPDSLPVACGLPFVVKDDGSLTFLHGEGITDVRVMRMEPYYSTTDRLNNYFPGSRFESANDRAFQKDSCAYKIPCHPHYAWGSIRMDTIQERRYWRHVGKPAFAFHLAELHARIKSLLRRNMREGEKKIVFGNIEILPEKFEVQVGGKPIELNRKEYDILVYFMLRPNRLVNKSTLAESVWGDHIDQVDNFDFIYAQIKNLRKRLKDAGSTPELKAVYGIGYKFVLE